MSEPKFEHEYLPQRADDESFAGVGDGGIYCHKCLTEGDPRWGRHEGETDPISWGELRHEFPHGTTCDNCYSPLVGARNHTESECQYGEDCEHFDPEEHASKYDQPHAVLEDMLGRGIDIHHKPEIPHLPENHTHDWGSQEDLEAERFEGEQWAHAYHQRKRDETDAERAINEMFQSHPGAEMLRSNPQGPTFQSKRHGHKEASMQKKAYESECYGCGMHYNGFPRQCEVCGSGEIHSTDLQPAPPGNRFFSEHPSGYRAEWKQSAPTRLHIYEGDAPVDSPGMPGWSPEMRSSEREEWAKGITQKHVDRALKNWVKENGDAYMDFNHPTDRPSYGERHGFTSARKHAYGETKAPAAVDTLRDSNCPVCGEMDAYDGDQCQVCGFIAPPKMFQDPDLERAKLLDLRANPATGDPNDTDPNVGQNLPPVDPSAVDDDGNVQGQQALENQTDPNNTNGEVEVEVRGLGDTGGGPIDPDQVDEDGNVVGGPEDPEAAEQRVNQGGEPFTKGPNAPTPAEPAEPQEDPEDEEGEEVEDQEVGEPEGDGDQDGEEQADDGQAFGEQSGEPEPGDPGDGFPDLMCPACGFEADAAHPTSEPSNPQEPANAGDGMLAGDVCPNCGKATLMTSGEVEQEMQAAQGQQPVG